MSNIILCQRCAKTIISDELETHECSPETIGVQEIGLDYWFKGDIDENGDEVLIAKGLNGILYNLVLCKHNPPHPNTHPTVFDKEKNRRRFDRTTKQQVY